MEIRNFDCLKNLLRAPMSSRMVNGSLASFYDLNVAALVANMKKLRMKYQRKEECDVRKLKLISIFTQENHLNFHHFAGRKFRKQIALQISLHKLKPNLLKLLKSG